jgi:hypothetical protein
MGYADDDVSALNVGCQQSSDGERLQVGQYGCRQFASVNQPSRGMTVIVDPDKPK